MAEEQTESIEVPAPGGSKKKLLLFGAGGLVLAAIGVVAVLFFMRPDPATPGSENPVAAIPTAGPPIYQSLHPPLVVNFKDLAGEAHYMQISMEVMSRKQSVINAVREHTPAIRNALILHYSGSVYETIETREGKEQMLSEGRDEIERIVAEAAGERGVEALYFTSLVIQ